MKLLAWVRDKFRRQDTEEIRFSPEEMTGFTAEEWLHYVEERLKNVSDEAGR